MYQKLSGLYAITDEKLTPDESVFSQVEECLSAGVSIVQYRNKTKTDDEVEDVCRALQALCQQHSAIFIIDDRPYLAQKIKADGLHIGKNDMSLYEARKIFKDGVIGVSCYGSIAKAQQAQNEGATYVAFGSFFHSPTKPQSGIIPQKVLQKAQQRIDIPICAIGGIDQKNICEIAQHKPQMISVVSAVFAGNIKENVHKLIKGMNI